MLDLNTAITTLVQASNGVVFPGQARNELLRAEMKIQGTRDYSEIVTVSLEAIAEASARLLSGIERNPQLFNL